MDYLNTFSYQTLVLHQFAGALPNYPQAEKTVSRDKKMIISFDEEKLVADSNQKM